MKKLTRAQAMGLDDETAAKIDEICADLQAAGIDVDPVVLALMLQKSPFDMVEKFKVQVRPPPPVRMTRVYGSILENYEKLSNPD